MSAQVVFLNTDFSPRLDDGFVWQVEQMSWQLPGGAAAARLAAILPFISEQWFSSFSNQILGLPLEIRGGDGEVLWNGWVQKVSYTIRHTRLTRSLQEMYNRVIVRFPRQAQQAGPLDRWQYTDWMDAAASQARFGRREKLVSISQADPYLANQVLLASFHALQSLPSLKIESDPTAEEGWLEIQCSGWWQRLGWELDGNQEGLLEHLDGGKSQVLVGRLSSQAQLAQSVWNEEPLFRLAQVWLRAANIGQTEDDLQVAVHADDHGKPGMLLAQMEHATATVDGGWQWHCWQLAEPCLLAFNESSWIVIKRSGAINSDAYYLLESDDGSGYARGSLKRWDGSNWQNLAQDIRFCLAAQEQTTILLSNLIDSHSSSSFIRALFTWYGSDRVDARWRPFEISCQARIERWLQGSPRQSAVIDSERNLQVFALPREREIFDPMSMKPAPTNRLDAPILNRCNLLGARVFSDTFSENEHWVQAIEWRQGKGYTWRFLS